MQRRRKFEDLKNLLYCTFIHISLLIASNLSSEPCPTSRCTAVESPLLGPLRYALNFGWLVVFALYGQPWKQEPHQLCMCLPEKSKNPLRIYTLPVNTADPLLVTLLTSVCGPEPTILPRILVCS